MPGRPEPGLRFRGRTEDSRFPTGDSDQHLPHSRQPEQLILRGDDRDGCPGNQAHQALVDFAQAAYVVGAHFYLRHLVEEHEGESDVAYIVTAFHELPGGVDDFGRGQNSAAGEDEETAFVSQFGGIHPDPPAPRSPGIRIPTSGTRFNNGDGSTELSSHLSGRRGSMHWNTLRGRSPW